MTQFPSFHLMKACFSDGDVLLFVFEIRVSEVHFLRDSLCLFVCLMSSLMTWFQKQQTCCGVSLRTSLAECSIWQDQPWRGWDMLTWNCKIRTPGNVLLVFYRTVCLVFTVFFLIAVLQGGASPVLTKVLWTHLLDLRKKRSWGGECLLYMGQSSWYYFTELVPRKLSPLLGKQGAEVTLRCCRVHLPGLAQTRLTRACQGMVGYSASGWSGSAS